MKNNKKYKTIFRIVGLICLPLGLIFLVLGIIGMSNFNTDMFLFSFVGIPLLFIGSVSLSFGFMKEVNSYIANENKGIAKDVTNYMLDGTRESISKTFSTINGNSIVCNKCNTTNDNDAKYCKNCGSQLNIICPHCKVINDSDSKFCKECGKELN